MQVLHDRYKREGLVGTIVFHLILFLVFLFVGLPYMVPKPEQGITVNFGTSNTGMGDVQPETAGEEVSNPTPEPQPEPTPPTETTPVEAQEEVVTQDTEEAPEVEATDKKTEEKPEEKPTEEEKEPEPEKTISNKLNNALNKFKNTSAQSGGSEGNDNKPGDKGQINGTMDGGAYTGGGTGNGDYQLGNRKAVSRPKPNYNCQEEGKVVVDIKVDRNGKTLKASIGKGTTNTASCLTSQAIQAALKTKWQPNPDAPLEQFGKITYHFILK